MAFSTLHYRLILLWLIIFGCTTLIQFGPGGEKVLNILRLLQQFCRNASEFCKLVLREFWLIHAGLRDFQQLEVVRLSLLVSLSQRMLQVVLQRLRLEKVCNVQSWICTREISQSRRNYLLYLRLRRVFLLYLGNFFLNSVNVSAQFFNLTADFWINWRASVRANQFLIINNILLEQALQFLE